MGKAVSCLCSLLHSCAGKGVGSRSEPMTKGNSKESEEELQAEGASPLVWGGLQTPARGAPGAGMEVLGPGPGRELAVVKPLASTSLL